MNILVTGATGTLAQNISKNGIVEFRVTKSSTFIDFQNTKPVESTLIHFASLTNAQTIAADTDFAKSVIVDGTLKLAKEFFDRGGKRFLYISTGHVYGPNYLEPVTELDNVCPSTDYATLKYSAELEIQKIVLAPNQEICIARVFSIFDNGMPAHFLAGKIEQQLKLKHVYPLINYSADVRDFMTIQEAQSKIMEVATKGMPGNIYNVSTGKATTVANRILQTYPEFPRELLEPSTSNFPYLVGNSAKLEKISS